MSFNFFEAFTICIKHPAKAICVLRTTCAFSVLTHGKLLTAIGAWGWGAGCRLAKQNSEKLMISFFLRVLNLNFSKAGLGHLHRALSLRRRIACSKASNVPNTTHVCLFFEVCSPCLPFVQVPTASAYLASLLYLAPNTHFFGLSQMTSTLLSTSSEKSVQASPFCDSVHRRLPQK